MSTSPSKTALMWTAREGDETLTKQLILQGVNINMQNPDGLTSLHFASQNNHIQCGIHLVEAGADVSVMSTTFQTPLNLSTIGSSKRPFYNHCPSRQRSLSVLLVMH